MGNNKTKGETKGISLRDLWLVGDINGILARKGEVFRGLELFDSRGNKVDTWWKEASMVDSNGKTKYKVGSGDRIRERDILRDGVFLEVTSLWFSYPSNHCDYNVRVLYEGRLYDILIALEGQINEDGKKMINRRKKGDVRLHQMGYEIYGDVSVFPYENRCVTDRGGIKVEELEEYQFHKELLSSWWSLRRERNRGIQEVIDLEIGWEYTVDEVKDKGKYVGVVEMVVKNGSGKVGHLYVYNNQRCYVIVVTEKDGTIREYLHKA